MAYVQLQSSNPMFSYILRKNPSSGMLIKTNRKGRLFAWYTPGNPQIFNIYFRDSGTEVSYSNDMFEYMDATRYNAPMFLVNAFTEFLIHMRKPDNEDVAGYENVLMINQIKCRSRSLETFQANFTDYNFETNEISPHNYRITIKTNKTIRELISLGQVIAIFNTLLNDDLQNLNYNDIDKYMNWIQVINAPYYIRHLFKLYFLKTHKLFTKYKPLLETYDKAKIEFEIGSTLEQRINAIRKHINFKSHVIDIGCGEGSYVRNFAPLLAENAEYHAIDTDEKNRETVKRLCERKQIENVIIWESLDVYIDTLRGDVISNATILLTEVMEHMSKEEASSLISKILNIFKSHNNKIIITTPNKDFNNNYKLFDDDVRNEDHKFEMTKNEFTEYIRELVNTSKINIENVKFFDIGDKVNDVQPTLAVIVEV